MLNQTIITQLQAIVGDIRVKTDADSLKTWGCDWTKHYTPAAQNNVCCPTENHG